jgi:maltose alpha-D-glucosyltransferase/alpha-amylase
MMINDPLWYKDAIFYEVFVRAFADSNSDGIGDLRGLTSKLDYLQWLGVDAIWMLPIFPSPLRDDGYDTSDYCGIHPDYGTLADFSALVTEAHRRDLRVIVELIPNHTSDQHPWFQASRDPHHPEHAKYRDWYVWSDTNARYAEARIIFLDSEPSNWTFDPVRGAYFWHRFFHHQPDLNYDNPEVQRAMLRSVQFWLDRGADGIRVDAPPYLYEREGTNCENLPETHAYLKKLRAFMDEHYPGRILLCEANQWPQDVRPYFGDGDEFHMGFHFPIMPRIFMALKKGNAQDMVDILNRTPSIPANCQWCIFLRNHDELTLEMVTPEEREWMWREYAPDPRMKLNLGIRRRLAPLLDNDRRKIELAHSLLFTLPGSPILYYGDEIGMGDDIRLDDRNGVRTPMQWEAGTGAGFSEASPELFYAPVINSRAYAPSRVNVESQRRRPHSLWNTVRRMIAARKLHKCFGWGEFRWIESADGAIAAYERQFENEHALILHNLAGETKSFPLNRGYTDMLSNERIAPGRITLAPLQYKWLLTDNQ